MTRSPISRVGGKYYLAKKIVPLLPAHTSYIEPFGGAMHVLFRKEPSKIEIYNDIDSNLVNFFKVVCKKPDELFKQLDFSLYSREVFLNAHKNLSVGDDVERACNFYITNRQCFGGKMKTWGITTSGSEGFFTYEQRIREAHKRLKTVYIENLDWHVVIQKYDKRDALFYLDPPYMFNTNRSKSKQYDNEMDATDHAELVDMLKGIKGKFILSGYENALYDCFERVNLGEASMYVKATTSGNRMKKTEYVWKNF